MDDLRKQLFYEQKNGYDLIGPEEHVAADNYCRGYMEFLNDSRTEREAVINAIRLAQQYGFVPYQPGMALTPGMKIYTSNRGKAL
ncbi:MAG: aminopeptidase, partial [Oscillospiraceae bacterium]|nr:aminopeptidase [Oscillospiraceae bacterium]